MGPSATLRAADINPVRGRPLSPGLVGKQGLMNRITKRPTGGDIRATAPEYGDFSKRLWKVRRLQDGIGRNTRIELSIHRYANAGSRVPPDLVIAATRSLKFKPGIQQQPR